VDREALRRGDPDAIRAALATLGVKRLLLAIHDVSFPSDPDEDVGRGSPATRGAQRLFGYLGKLGFTGLQLGPQGQTSRDNASPYDGTIFSRHVGTISLAALRGIADERLLDAAVLARPGGPAQHARAHDTMHGLLASVRIPDDQRARLVQFRHQHAR
jgi:4-alpha-glucanotransferase